MKEDVLDNPVELRTAVPAPRFEDRRVVMRAQPVVPLDEIRSKLKLRRLWFLSGAFAVAMILGAASALVAVRVKRIAANNEIPQIEEPADTTIAETPPAQEEPTADPEALAEAETPVHQPTRITKPQPPLAQRPRVVDRDREPLSSHTGVQPSEDEQLEQIREAVLYERWQERRARRVARRERRNRGDRDLSRVDEIFEGPRRSQRP
ncbi:MAG TPA: hypothetical protein VFM63_13770 [Pyrinomonadaceae bacterium]|nr:hypothetical protein [Pyrinomonadaceae bacterium]